MTWITIYKLFIVMAVIGCYLILIDLIKLIKATINKIKDEFSKRKSN